MKPLIKNIYHFFPVQLFLLHFRKYQVLLLFWYFLVATISGALFKIFGADALLLAPEYLGSVNMLGTFITGMALGIFIMSWNITTFILQSKRFKFLATTKKPFVKYCINNAVLPLFFLSYYIYQLYQFNHSTELKSVREVIYILVGLMGGIVFILFLSFAYFFGADITITKTITPLKIHPELLNEHHATVRENAFGLKVTSFIDDKFKIKKPRIVSHYRSEYIDMVFNRHHLAAIISIMLAFVFLVCIGFFLENPYFELPAAASTLIFFSVTMAVIGAVAYFLQSWSLSFMIILIVLVNYLFQHQYIDPRNKAYGINYAKLKERPIYTTASLSHMCNPENIKRDSLRMITVLNNWKSNQSADKPLMLFINVSGGGLRSASFVMNTLQKLDSISGKQLMRQTFLISGASGGMLSAAYYRELYRAQINGKKINPGDAKYNEYISRDLLNPVFTSMIARDLFAPVQKFELEGYQYLKDRGYAFEKKLSDNTEGVLNVQLKDYYNDEYFGKVPLIFFNTTVKRDGRKMVISTQPVSFMMKPSTYNRDTSFIPDAVDFSAMFKDLSPLNLRLLTALRMNATFPYVLPNVWLPTEPVIDVMDAGLRDNFGQETTLRFIQQFDEWIKTNTAGVLIIQLRDRPTDNWQNPFETNSLTDMIVNPGTMLQHNWYKMQNYAQADQFSYFPNTDKLIQKINIMYIPEKQEKTASLNFHIAGRERRDVVNSLNHPINKAALDTFRNLCRRLQ